MKTNILKRHAFRCLLALHFFGLALTLGTRFANLVIGRETSGGDLRTLAFGRDLTGSLAQTLVPPGFLLMAVTGIVMVVLRYGRHPPLWVWIKVGLNASALLLVSPFVAPALAAARQWAHWSVEHNRLAPEFQDAAAQASFYGSIVFSLFLLNIPVAIWKPVSISLAKIPALRAWRAEHQRQREL
ncbi:MAG TPA: hypothetical protein VM689_22375 [Aliidongia sp.]|nr:hypothetical protein [Aliidongia sp.]